MITHIKASFTEIKITKKDDDNVVGELLSGILSLENKEITVLTINEYSFKRSAFEFKNGRFNWTKAVDLCSWAYCSDIMHELTGETPSKATHPIFKTDNWFFSSASTNFGF